MDLSAISQRDLLHASPDPTVIVDENGKIVFASQRVIAVFGYEPEELVGSPVETLVPERHRREHQGHRGNYLRALRPRPMGQAMELYGRHKSGREFPVEISLSPVHTDQGVLISSTIRDITERKRTEELLARERAFLDSMIKTAPTIVLLLGPEGRIEQVNPYFEELCGYRGRDVIGKDWFETFIPERDREEIRRVFRETMDRGFNGGHTNPILTREGVLCHVEWLSKTLENGGGRVIGLLCIGRDVGPQLRHEEALQMARRDAERANASKSRFLAAASHDLRQPLQSLGLYLSVLTRQLERPKALEISAKMRKSLDTMGELLDALLDISRLDSGAVVPEMRDFHIDTVIDRILTDNAQQAEEKGLEFACAASDCVVHSDPGLLERVIANLVTNAIRYTERGRVAVTCEPVEGRARITVSDTGIGIPAEALDRVFDEYYQLDNPVRDRRKGLGLGLSIARHIAHLLDLELRVASTVGKGSSFTVEVPLGDLHEEDSAAALSMASPSREPVVLFVEDDPAVIDATTMLFESSGVCVHAAIDGAAAIGTIEGGLVPDLIVCDYRLPGMNGIEVISRVRLMLAKEVPAVLMTGDTSTREIAVADLPNCTVLHKPVDTDQLLSLVEGSVGASLEQHPS